MTRYHNGCWIAPGVIIGAMMWGIATFFLVLLVTEPGDTRGPTPAPMNIYRSGLDICPPPC